MDFRWTSSGSYWQSVADSHFSTAFFNLSQTHRRWSTPKSKDLNRDLRKEFADRIRLARLSAPWRTPLQLRKFEDFPKAAHDTFRFAVLGDAEPGRFWIFRKFFNVPGIFEMQVRDIQRRGVDFSLQLGDMVSRGTVKNYLRFFRDLSRWGVSVPYLTVIGNHDRSFPHGNSDDTLYNACFGSTNYFFDRGAARFVVLDSSTHDIEPWQLAWLNQALDTDKIKLVFTHMPPVTLAWARYAGARLGGFRAGSSDFVQLVSRRGVARVYCGHIHAFGIADYQGVRYVLSGGGGSPLFPCGVRDRFYHYLVVSVGPRGVQETIHNLDGRVLTIPRGKVLLHH